MIVIHHPSATVLFRRTMRVFGFLLGAWLLVIALAPGIIVADFLVERERIDRELCVQRLVPEEVRTCHGQCYLMRSLKRVEQQEQRLPDTLRELRLSEYVIEHRGSPVVPPCIALPLHGATVAAALPDGWRAPMEPVPWG